MNRLGHVRRVTLFVLLLLVAAAPAWAEYCKSQGSPRIPKSEIGAYDAAAFLSTTEIVASEAKHLPWGRPDCSRILFHVEYVLCYDVDRKVALWASYRLEAGDVVAADRVNAFRTDPRLPIDQNPSCDDYGGSGFDRGHIVPRSDMNRSLVAMVNTFFLTNMTPQRPNVNQGTWARLEDWVRASHAHSAAAVPAVSSTTPTIITVRMRASRLRALWPARYSYTPPVATSVGQG